MPLTPKEKEKLAHEKRKREIANTFTGTVQEDSYSEGAEEWMVGIIMTVILAIIAILLVAPDPISKLAAVIAALVTGVLAAIGIAVIVARSSDKFIEAKRVRDREEDAEDDRHKETLGGLT